MVKNDALGELIKSKFGTFQRFSEITGVGARNLFNCRNGAIPQDRLRGEAMARSLGIPYSELSEMIKSQKILAPITP